ncbi:MAG: hypothetical protein DGJ47_000498 [Rickettsiaceae bacterium]
MTPELAEAFNLQEIDGLLVVNTQKGGSGETFGVKRGDIITLFNGKKIRTPRKLELFIAECEIGEKVELSIIRNQQPINITVEIFGQNENQSDLPEQQKEETSVLNHSGVVFSDITLSEITSLNISPRFKGIFVKEIQKGSDTDLQLNDIIISIDQQNIENIEQFEQIYSKLASSNTNKTVLLVKRQDTNIFIPYMIQSN